MARGWQPSPVGLRHSKEAPVLHQPYRMAKAAGVGRDAYRYRRGCLMSIYSLMRTAYMDQTSNYWLKETRVSLTYGTPFTLIERLPRRGNL